jgi:hypothetical protein
VSAAATARATGPGGARLVDVVVTPAVADPFCATAIVVQTTGGGTRYAVATARVATAPSFVAVDRCALTGPDAPVLRPPTRPSTRAVRWGGEWEAPLADLVALARSNCEVAAMLRFVRVPVWSPAGEGAIDFGDLRYAGRTSRSFADFRIPLRPARCPRAVPPWRPPREALLTPG